jgi:hypothetical protein
LNPSPTWAFAIPRDMFHGIPRLRASAVEHLVLGTAIPEGNPLGHLFRYLILGRGDTAPVVREIIREVEGGPGPHASRPRRLTGVTVRTRDGMALVR